MAPVFGPAITESSVLSNRPCIGRAQLSVFRHRDLTELRREPALALIPGIFLLPLQPFLALSFLPCFQIQIAPEARVTSATQVVFSGDRIQVSEWFQPWYIWQGLRQLQRIIPIPSHSSSYTTPPFDLIDAGHDELQ